MEKNKVHLVLSSGGVRCISYAGAIAELERNSVEFASVSACSAGSIVGALVCAGLSGEELKGEILKLDFKRFFGSKRFPFLWRFSYPFSEYKDSLVAEVYCRIINTNPSFDELEIPFATVGIDILTKRFLVYSQKTDPRMLVSEALKIGMAVPMQTPPYSPPGRLVVDAAVATESPVWLATDYDDDLPIIVLKPKKQIDISPPKNIGRFIGSLINSGVESRDEQLLSQIPGVSVIEIDCGEIGAMQFDLSREQKQFLIERGKTAVEKAIELYGRDFSFNTTMSMSGKSAVVAGRDDEAQSRADKMIRKFNRRLPNLLRNQVFISYSHKDGEWLERFQIALKPFVRNQSFKVWADEKIEAGDDWQKEIDQALESTKVALLLVTENFLASDYINQVELEHFIKQSKKKNVVIHWVAITATNYEETPLKTIQCVNQPDKPLESFEREYERDKAITEICRKIKSVFNRENNL